MFFAVPPFFCIFAVDNKILIIMMKKFAIFLLLQFAIFANVNAQSNNNAYDRIETS